jgi:hypothetical protein
MQAVVVPVKAAQALGVGMSISTTRSRPIDGPLRAGASITVEPLDGGRRSRVTFVLDFQGRGMGRLLVPDVVSRLARRQAPRSYRNLKQRLERGG